MYKRQIISCADCGEVSNCHQCNVSLTYHQFHNKLLCHYCGFSEVLQQKTCHSCKSNNLLYRGTGTQKVEYLLNEIFTDAIIARIDNDTSRGGQGITSILKSFSEGGIDILLGTQMIAKGLDFPNTTLVGTINSDLGLYLPDFRSGERIFQLIYQASGRAGRKNKPGEVIIQSFVPENSIIYMASKLNVIQYYEYELKERECLNYPPYSWLVKIEVTGLEERSVNKISNEIVRRFDNEFEGLEILGPSPCFLEKVKKRYRFQIVLKSLKINDQNGKLLHKFVDENINSFKKKYPLKQNRINIHFDPLSLI